MGNVIAILFPGCVELSSLQWTIHRELKKNGQGSALVPQWGQQLTNVESTVILPK